MRASAVAEAPDAVEIPLEKTGPAFEPLKDIESIQEILPHRCVFERAESTREGSVVCTAPPKDKGLGWMQVPLSAC